MITRSNIGNIATNSLQTASVAATTASRLADYNMAKKQRSISDAASALNNMTADEVRRVGEMRAGKLREELADYEENTNDIDELMSSANTPQSQELNTFIKNNISYHEDIDGFNDIVTDDELQKIIGGIR